MIQTIWLELLTKPIFNLLVYVNSYVGNLAIAIIVLTLILKTLLFPVNIPNIKMSAKKKDLDDELNAIKAKYKDKTEVAQKQMELYKKHGINPMAGCLPNIIQLLVLLALYHVFINTLKNDISADLYYFSFLRDVPLNLKFLYFDVSKPDPYYILPVLAGAFQFGLSKILMPTIKKGEEIAKKTPSETDDMMYSMQQQMMYVTPLLTIFIGSSLPSGLVLYWAISSLYSLVQTYYLRKFYISNK